MMILQQTRGNLSSGDQLALDLPFAATKSLTARVGPTPILTRASGATYVGSDGLIHGVDTSTTSNSIGTGSKTFTLSAPAGQDQLWRTGDAVEATNGTNSMFGAVTSYDANTQVLVCNITSITGSGTFNSWRIGYRGPRFDHDPANPTVCRGLLIEEQRTNLLVRSQEFNLTWGTNNSMTVTPDAVIAPDGTMTADAINFDSNVTSRIIQFAGSAAIHTFSVWLRANSATTCILDGQASGAISSPAVVNVTTNWQRFTYLTSSFPNGTAVWNVRIQNNSTGTSGTIFAWGAQLEAGSFPTSYIPTTTSALTRSADVCNITGAAFTSFYNQPEGTLFADVTPQTVAQLSSVFAVNTTTSNNQHGIYKTNAALSASGLRWGATTVLVGISTQAAILTSTDVATSRSRLSYAYKLDDFAFAYSGAIVGTDTSGTLPSPTSMHIGCRDGSLQINGHLASIRYYKKRLANAKLQALTV